MHFERPTSQKADFPAAKRVAFLFITAVIGLMTGAIGFALALRWYGDTFGSALLGLGQGLNSGRTVLSIEQPLIAVASQIEESVVIVSRAHSESAGRLRRALDPALFVGSAALITSDGWLVTSQMPSASGKYEIIQDGETYAVERIVVDSYTGLFFLKTTLRDAEPVDLFDQPLAYGESVVRGSRDASGAFVIGTTLVSQPLQQSFISASEAVQSTAVLGEFVQLQELHEDGMYFNLRGQLLGLPAGSPAHLVPARHIKVSFEQFLRNQKDSDLGATFVSIELTAGRKAVMLYHPTRNPVRSNSPAQRAGLTAGDVVVAVNGVTLDNFQTLPYLWRRFQHQETVTFQVLRSGRELTLELHQS